MENNGGKQENNFISLSEYANKLQNTIKNVSINKYWDTDDYETEEEFDETLNYIKQKQEFLDAFIETFDDSDVMIRYFDEKKEDFVRLAQCYRNTKDNKGENYKVATIYSLQGADDNIEINNALYAFQEEAKKYLKYANLYITAIEYIQLAPSLKPYFDDPQDSTEK